MEMLTNFFIVGHPYQLLQQITLTGKKYGLSTGVCGADSGGVPTQEIAPSVFIPKVTIQSYKSQRFTERLLENERHVR